MNPRSPGFTLVELLIAIVLTAIIFTLGFAALRLATGSWERTDALVTRASDVRTVSELLRRQVSQMLPEPEGSRSRNVLFVGQPQLLEFIAPAPPQSGRLAGLYRYRYRVEETEEGRALVLDYQPYTPGGSGDWDRPHETAVLIPKVGEGVFSYYGSLRPRDPPEWREEWQDQTRLPERVRLVLRPVAGAPPWPDLLLPVRAGSAG